MRYRGLEQLANRISQLPYKDFCKIFAIEVGELSSTLSDYLKCSMRQRKGSIMRQSIEFIILFITVMIFISSAAQAAGETDMVRPLLIYASSTDCTDGTQFFAVYTENGDVGIYLLRDGKLLYYTSSDHSYITSVICLKQGILYTGGGPYLSMDILRYENGSFVNEEAGGAGRRSSKITSTEKKTVILDYGDDRKGLDTTIISRLVLKKPVLIPKNGDAKDVTIDTMYKIEGKEKPVRLTALAHCRSHDVLGYLDEDGMPKLDVSRSTSINGLQLPFIATNSICDNDNDSAYIFGKQDGKLRAGKIIFDERMKEPTFKLIPLSEAPLKPYIK